VQRERAESAQAYFSANAAHWDRIRSMHVAEAEVEAAIRRALGEETIGVLLDLGTGTGRVLELLAPIARQAIGIDSSRDMLAIARANLERGGLRHCQIRHGDIYALPFANAVADVVTIHQVLHFLDEPPRALAEAARVLKPQGRMLVVDFAPHDFEFLREGHAHRRLGIAQSQLAHWADRAGLQIAHHDLLPPPERRGGSGLTVSLWLLRQRREDAAERADSSRTARPAAVS
jgi:ubiquinone/menaquinone biosynthesis C-methylase UbiE